MDDYVLIRVCEALTVGGLYGRVTSHQTCLVASIRAVVTSHSPHATHFTCR